MLESGPQHGPEPRSDDQTGPKDLVRALAWFLTLRRVHSTWPGEVTRQQKGVFPSHVGNPIVNDVRWNRFVYWAPALGFASRALLENERSGQRQIRLVPDCTVAVRRTDFGRRGRRGRVSTPRDAIDRITKELPVLPGGRYSRSLGLPASPTSVASSLSFALLCGTTRIGSRSGAPQMPPAKSSWPIPMLPAERGVISEITITGSLDA